MRPIRLTLTLSLLLLATIGTMAQSRHRYTPPRPDYSRYSGTSRRSIFASEPDHYFGFRVGLSASHVNSDDRYLDGGDTQTGLNIGAVAGISLTPRAPLYLEAGIAYIEKGGKGTYERKHFTYDLNYIEVPLVLKYRAFVADNFSIDPFFGGYLACGVGGKIKDFGDRKAESAFSDDAFRRFDGGLRLGVGLSYDLLYVEAGYDFGLANVCNDTFDTSHNGCFFANVGVNF